MNLNLLVLVEQAFSANLQDLLKAKQTINLLLFVIDNPKQTLAPEARAEIDALLQRKPQTLQINIEKGEI